MLLHTGNVIAIAPLMCLARLKRNWTLQPFLLIHHDNLIFYDRALSWTRDFPLATVGPVHARHSVLHHGQEKVDRDSSAAREGSIEADMYFLQRDELWETVKPYGMRYYAEGIAQSNVRREKHRIILKDIRQLTIMPSINIQGFSVMALESRMAYEDFNDYSKIKSVYHQDIVVALKNTLGAKHVFVMDNAVCTCHFQHSIPW